VRLWSEEDGRLVWVEEGLYVGWMAMTILCVVASIQAVRRGLAGAWVSGRVLRAFGMAALAMLIARSGYWATTSPTWRGADVSDLPALVGTLLTIVGGTLMGPDPPRLPSASVPAPRGR